MSFQTVFKRYEYKYLITKDEKELILNAIAPYMEIDDYGKSNIRNIYYDTDNYLLIRRSIESPVYKEKLRIRSYFSESSSDTVFVELKKKYDSVVYKRRIALKEEDAINWINRKNKCPIKTQITNEIDYFLDFYETLKPSVFLSYDREAYFTKEKSDFRITFDDNILCRNENLSLKAAQTGTALLPDNVVLMEIKCSGSIPLWLVSALSKYQIRKTSFSKYGTAYKTMIYPTIKANNMEALKHA